METSYEENLTSKYNDANFSIMRLHNLWLLVEQYVRSGNLVKLKTELDNIWIELYNDVCLKKKQTKELLKKNHDLMLAIAKSDTRGELYFNLMSRCEFLRTVQHLAGKAGAYEDADSESFEQG